MSEDTKTSPTQTEEAHGKALATLVDLLDAGSDSLRLQAALAILGQLDYLDYPKT